MTDGHETRSWKGSKPYLDMSLAALATIGIPVYYVGKHLFNYWMGLNHPLGRLLYPFGPPCFIVPIYMASLVLILVLIVRWFILNIRFGIMRILLQTFLIVVPISLKYMVPKLMSVGYIARTEGCLERMKKDADIPAIQTWLETAGMEIINEHKSNERSSLIDESKWPEVIKKFSPRGVFVMESKNNRKPYVRIDVGGVLEGSFGLIVGVGAEEIPLNDWHTSEYRLELTPNAFAYTGLKHER